MSAYKTYEDGPLLFSGSPEKSDTHPEQIRKSLRPQKICHRSRSPICIGDLPLAHDIRRSAPVGRSDFRDVWFAVNRWGASALKKNAENLEQWEIEIAVQESGYALDFCGRPQNRRRPDLFRCAARRHIFSDELPGTRKKVTDVISFVTTTLLKCLQSDSSVDVALNESLKTLV